MARSTTTDAPIHNDIIADMAEEYDLDADEFGEFLADANAEWNSLLTELRNNHEVIVDDADRLMVLAQHGDEVDVMADHVSGDHDVGFWDPDATPSQMLRVAHDRQACSFEYDAFGGKQSTVDAVGVADAIVVSKE